MRRRVCPADGRRGTLAACPRSLEVEAGQAGRGGARRSSHVDVERTDPLVVGEGSMPPSSVGRSTAIDRRGKLLVVLTDGPTVGIHFGMTGRLLRDGVAAIERLHVRRRPATTPVWDRWAVGSTTAARLRLHDPRRLGRVLLEPDVDRLGPDALTLTTGELARGAGRAGGRR